MCIRDRGQAYSNHHKPSALEQLGEERIYFSLQASVHHKGKSGQAFEAGSWSRNHAGSFAPWLTQPAFYIDQVSLSRDGLAHHGLGSHRSIISRNNHTRGHRPSSWRQFFSYGSPSQITPRCVKLKTHQDVLSCLRKSRLIEQSKEQGTLVSGHSLGLLTSFTVLFVMAHFVAWLLQLRKKKCFYVQYEYLLFP